MPTLQHKSEKVIHKKTAPITHQRVTSAVY